MSTVSRKRIRSGRTASLELPPGRFAPNLDLFAAQRRAGTAGRRAWSAALAICVLTRSWVPPFSYREGYVPDRSIAAKVAFRQLERTGLGRGQRPGVPAASARLSPGCQGTGAAASGVTERRNGNRQSAGVQRIEPRDWKQFEPVLPAGESPDLEQQEGEFDQFVECSGWTGRPCRSSSRLSARRSPRLSSMACWKSFRKPHGEGNQKEIAVYPIGRPKDEYLVQVQDVLIGDAESLHKSLKENLPPPVAERVFVWVKPRLHTTLTLDEEATQKAREAAAAAVPAQYTLLRARTDAGPGRQAARSVRSEAAQAGARSAMPRNCRWGKWPPAARPCWPCWRRFSPSCGHYLFYHRAPAAQRHAAADHPGRRGGGNRGPRALGFARSLARGADSVVIVRDDLRHRLPPRRGLGVGRGAGHRLGDDRRRGAGQLHDLDRRRGVGHRAVGPYPQPQQADQSRRDFRRRGAVHDLRRRPVERAAARLAAARARRFATRCGPWRPASWSPACCR